MNIIKKAKRFLAIRFPLQRNATKRIISFWEKGGADFDYYQNAEQEHWMKVFWGADSPFVPLFQKLDLDYTLEIACGTGRHSAKIIDKVKQLYLLDSSEGAINIAKERFSSYSNVCYINNKSGFGIPDDIIKNESLTAVFSYDAMVHFEKESVKSYLEDSYRVLKPGCYGLFHHSNYNKNPNGKFTDNPGWRNYMTQELFSRYAKEYGFEIVHSQVFSFSCPESDCITLVRKPLVKNK